VATMAPHMNGGSDLNESNRPPSSMLISRLASANKKKIAGKEVG